jgi:rod shape-determining protein MreC
LELEFVTQTQDMKAGDRLVSSGMGQVYPKNYPVAEIVSVFTDPGQDFATIKARPLAQLDSTRHVLLVSKRAESQTSVRAVADIVEAEVPAVGAGEEELEEDTNVPTAADQIPALSPDASVQ